MKKEAIKEALTKAKDWMKSHKKEVTPLCLALAALAAIIGLTSYAYRTGMFETTPVVSEKKEDTDAKEGSDAAAAGNTSKVNKKDASGRTAKDASLASSAEGSAKGKEETIKKEQEESRASQIGTSEKSEKEKTKTKEISAVNTPAPTASPAVTPDAPESVQSEKEESSSAATTPAAPVQESVPAVQVQAAPTQVPYQPAIEPDPQPVHEHTWVPVTVTIHHDAVTHTAHHDAVTQAVHHDAITHEEPVYEFRTICSTCGADITGHIPDHIGPVCQGSYSAQQVQTGVNVVTDQEAYDEEIVVQEAWDETITDQAAYDDVVTTGYRCSGCGATRQ